MIVMECTFLVWGETGVVTHGPCTCSLASTQLELSGTQGFIHDAVCYASHSGSLFVKPCGKRTSCTAHSPLVCVLHLHASFMYTKDSTAFYVFNVH